MQAWGGRGAGAFLFSATPPSPTPRSANETLLCNDRHAPPPASSRRVQPHNTQQHPVAGVKAAHLTPSLSFPRKRLTHPDTSYCHTGSPHPSIFSTCPRNHLYHPIPPITTPTTSPHPTHPYTKLTTASLTPSLSTRLHTPQPLLTHTRSLSHPRSSKYGHVWV